MALFTWSVLALFFLCAFGASDAVYCSASYPSCLYGCCGTFNERCCSYSSSNIYNAATSASNAVAAWLIGVIVAIVVFVVAVIVGVVICIVKATKNRQRVAVVQSSAQPNVSVVSTSQHGSQSAQPPGYGAQPPGYGAPGPAPPPAYYNNPAYPPAPGLTQKA